MSSPDSPNSPKPSAVPSWIMLGFLVGVLTMWLFRGGEDPRTVAAETPSPSPPAPAVVEAPALPTRNPLAQGERPSIEIVQALFEELRHWVFWSDERTEIAVWNSSTLGFTDHFEVLRTAEGDFFRALPGFSRLPLEGYGPDNSPLLFTETAEQRARRYYAANPNQIRRPESPAPIEFNELPQPPGGGR